MELVTRAITKASTFRKVTTHFNAEAIVNACAAELVNHAENVLLPQLKEYPLRPQTNPHTGKRYRYKRTFNLRNNWEVSPLRVRNGVLEVLITNDVVDPKTGDYYSALVQDEKAQRPVHKPLWVQHTKQVILRRNAPVLNGRIHSAISREARQ